MSSFSWLAISIKQRIPRHFKCAIKISGAVIDTINFHARSPNYHKEPSVQNTLFLSIRRGGGENGSIRMQQGERGHENKKRKGGMKIKRRKRRHDVPGDGLKRCCYITADSAMAVSPNGLCYCDWPICISRIFFPRKFW
jgi:hypothetical protein